VRHPTEGSNTLAETDAGEEGEMRDHRDASRTITGCNWQVQYTGLLQILPTVEKLLDLNLSPCRGTTSNATAAICSQAKRIQFRNYMSTPRIQLRKKYMMHQLEHKAKQSPTSSAK